MIARYLSLAAALLSLHGCGSELTYATIDAQAPAFSLESTTGKNMTLGGFAGEFVVLSFWTTTCAPCIKEVPALNEIHEVDGVSVIGVALDEDGSGRVAATAERVHMQYPVLYGDQALFQSYRGRGVPHMALIDVTGRLRRLLTGAREGHELLGIIEELRGTQ